MPGTAPSQLERPTAADHCACEHPRAGHYRDRGVCRKLSCSCSAYRAPFEDGPGGAVQAPRRAHSL